MTSKSHNHKSNQGADALDCVNDLYLLSVCVSVVDFHLSTLTFWHSLNLSSSVQISNVCFWGRRPQHPRRHSSGQRPRWWWHNLLHNSRQRGWKLCHRQPERWHLLNFPPRLHIWGSQANWQALCQITHSIFSNTFPATVVCTMNALCFQSHCGKILKVDVKSCNLCHSFHY